MRLHNFFKLSLLFCSSLIAVNTQNQAPDNTHNKNAIETQVDCPHTLGFTTLKKESNNVPLTLTGPIPEWLKGSLITIGPGVFELNKTTAHHWLDGFGMIHQFSLQDAYAFYTNKLIDSCYYQDCCKLGKLRGSAPEKKKSTWSKLTSALSSSKRPIYDNANINIACFNNQLVALTETPEPLTIDYKTLETKGKFSFNDKLEAHFSSAHPIFDPITQEWFGIAIQYAHTSSYIVYKMNANSNKRIPVATIPVGYPAYMHSFGLTKNYIILTEAPLIVSPYDLLLSDHSFIETFNWQPKNGTSFIVINRNTGKKVGVYKTDPFFTLHHVNAQEKDGAILLDLIAYKNPEIITKSFTYKHLKNPKSQFPSAHLKRYQINLKSNTVTAHALSPHNIELPQINPAKIMSDYHYLYAASNQNNTTHQLIKLDMRSKRHQIWHCNSCYPTEPIFVAKPNATAEDDGVILSLVLDARAEKSFLLVLDAQTFKEIARAYAPHHIPFTIHSKFLAYK